MRSHPSLRLAPILLLAGLAAPSAANAAESYDACTGFIDSVPTVISTQGTWCLRKDLATAITSGAAIGINTSNVTIDCNQFKLGGLGGGVSSIAFGISIGLGANNATIRNCNLRGFFYGVLKLDAPGDGAVVEDNRFDGSRGSGILMAGDGHVVRRNRILDTGESTFGNDRAGIDLLGDHVLIEDNQVIGVMPSTEASGATGIRVFGKGEVVRRNRIAQVIATGGNWSVGILKPNDSPAVIEGNVILNEADTLGHGISTSASAVCIGNRVTGYTLGNVTGCQDGGGNVAF